MSHTKAPRLSLGMGQSIAQGGQPTMSRTKYEKKSKLDQYCCIKLCCPLHQAAPALLEACQNALEGLNDIKNGGEFWSDNLGEDIKRLRQALATAEGRT